MRRSQRRGTCANGSHSKRECHTCARNAASAASDSAMARKESTVCVWPLGRASKVRSRFSSGGVPLGGVPLGGVPLGGVPLGGVPLGGVLPNGGPSGGVVGMWMHAGGGGATAVADDDTDEEAAAARAIGDDASAAFHSRLCAGCLQMGHLMCSRSADASVCAAKSIRRNVQSAHEDALRGDGQWSGRWAAGRARRREYANMHQERAGVRRGSRVKARNSL